MESVRCCLITASSSPIYLSSIFCLKKNQSVMRNFKAPALSRVSLCWSRISVLLRSILSNKEKSTWPIFTVVRRSVESFAATLREMKFWTGLVWTSSQINNINAKTPIKNRRNPLGNIISHAMNTQKITNSKMFG